MKNMKITTNPPGGAFNKGGSNHMVGWTGTGTQVPGQTAQEGSGPKRGIKAQAGPSTVMGFSSSTQNSRGAGPQSAGQSSQQGSRQEGFAHGGKTSMFGNRGSQRAEPGCSSPK